MLQNWNIVRLLRLIMGFGLLIQGITSHHTIMIAIGGLLFLQGVLNFGCCGSACNTNSFQKAGKQGLANDEAIAFEEIKS